MTYCTPISLGMQSGTTGGHFRRIADRGQSTQVDLVLARLPGAGRVLERQMPLGVYAAVDGRSVRACRDIQQQQ